LSLKGWARSFKKAWKNVRLGEDYSCITSSIGKFALVWFRNVENPKDAVIGKVERVIPKTPGQEKSVMIHTMNVIRRDNTIEWGPSNGQRPIPVSAVICYADFETETDLLNAVRNAVSEGTIRLGSLHFTYLGVAYLSSEAILELLERYEFLAWPVRSNNYPYPFIDVPTAIHNFQERPLDPSFLKDFLLAMAIILVNVRSLEVNVRYSVTNLLTNIIASMITVSVIEEEM
jgi:hypothetical protein